MRKIPSFIHIYNEEASKCLDFQLLVHYLSEKTGIESEIRGDIVKLSDNQRLLANEFARAKIVDLQKNELNLNPMPAEIEYEVNLLSRQKPSGLLYDGFYLQEIFRSLLPQQEHNLDHAHIIFTHRLCATYEDNRYHARAAVFGAPTLISTTGIVEAPAKPREFYLKKQQGIDLAILREEFKGRFIDYDDTRMTEVMKGYLMQAFFYYVFGNPFCHNKDCRLYNAHWQEEVIQSQIESKDEFCQMHTQCLRELYETKRTKSKEQRHKKS